MASKLIKPHFHTPPPTTTPKPEPPHLQSLISSLSLSPHIEGGYYLETDRSALLIPSPFPPSPPSTTPIPLRPGFQPHLRNLSTTIYYLLTPSGPQGGFHMNKARTVHTLHHGRGRYVLIHANGEIESYVVGKDVGKGERLQWIVEGGIWKASFLLPDEGDGGSREGLLISETVVPGFEFCDHEFLDEGGLEYLVGGKKKGELEWLLSPLGRRDRGLDWDEGMRVEG